MQVAGPFLVKGRRIRTGLVVQPGQSVTGMITGRVSQTPPGEQGQSFLFTGAGAGEAGPGYPAPHQPVACLVAFVGLAEHSFAPDGSFAATANGEIELDINNVPSTVYAGGYSVYLVAQALGEPRPVLPAWTRFRNLGQTVRVTDDFGQRSLAATHRNGMLHLAWCAPDDTLKHRAIDLATGVAGPVETVDGPPAVQVGYDVAFAKQGGMLHLFYTGGRKGGFLSGRDHGILRHAFGTTGSWTIEDIDGHQASPVSGTMSGLVGEYVDAVRVGNNEIHALYLAAQDHNLPGPTDSFGAPVGDLRHARFGPVTLNVGGNTVNVTGWFEQTVDGTRPPAITLFPVTGAVAADSGLGCTVIVDQAAQLHVFYFQRGFDPPVGKGWDLRHGVLEQTGATAQAWRLETLDGAGRTMANAVDQNLDKTGVGIGALAENGAIHVFHTQIAPQSGPRGFFNLRHGEKPPGGTGWRFTTIDGLFDLADEGGGQVFGSTAEQIDFSRKQPFMVGNRLSVIYSTRGGKLRHAFRLAGQQGWMFEDVDGHISDGSGRITRACGSPVVLQPTGSATTEVLYVDRTNGAIRWATLA